MKTEDRRACPSCGNELSEVMESCPVCMFRIVLAGGVESGESSTSDVFDEIADLLELRDENPFRIMSYRRAAQTARGIPPWINEKIAGMLRVKPSLYESSHPG
jgi:hypothetical protein